MSSKPIRSDGRKIIYSVLDVCKKEKAAHKVLLGKKQVIKRFPAMTGLNSNKDRGMEPLMEFHNECSGFRKKIIKKTKMSNNGNGDDGFRLVSSKRYTKSKSRKVLTKIPSLTAITLDNIYIDKESVTRKILAAKEDLLESTYHKTFFSKVNESLLKLESPKVVELLSFGLGHIGECTISQYQLTLLLCLKEKFEVPVSAYDPLFHTAECEILNDFGINVISDNEEGKRLIKSEGVTIAYLPHCPKQLTNNFLWKNWGIQLTHALLICNSLSRLIESQPERLLLETVPYLVRIFPYVKEFGLENNFKFTDIFNDTAIHIFPKQTLNSVPEDFWETKFECSYGDCPEFITSDMMNRLKI